MKSLHRLIAMVLLALWLPATTHCLLERSGLLRIDDCCGTESGAPEKSCEDSLCCTLGSGNYKTSDNQAVTAPMPGVLSLSLIGVSDSIEPDRPLLDRQSPLPPELPVRWQFSFRTALPPRAPSVIS